ncbi:DUF4493 domain-containing protein [Alistipes sp.]|uniref:DUF4493 domain-containing protein n=1 Tax=Alistipes sp. TaxID=1872444 RepID=UPI003AF04E39
MRRLLKYLVPALALLALACSKEPVPDTTDGTGALALRITTTRTADSGDYEPLDYLTVRIYKASGELIRKYTSRADLPARLELLAGEYRIAVEAGESVPASFTRRFYKGEQPFTVVARETTPVEVACKLQNTVVEVKFDEGVAENFGTNRDAWVMAAETFDEKLIESGTTPVLHYTADAAGYFVLPEGMTTLAWQFRGEHADKGLIVKTGTMTGIQSFGKYTLTFTYKPDLPGFIEGVFELVVDDSTDDADDTIIFSPDPTIEGDGFDIEEVQNFLTGEKRFNISTVKPMTEARLLFGGETCDLLAAATTPIEGVTAEHPDENTLTVTLSDAFFAGRPGGEQTLRFSVADNAGGTLTTDAVFRLQGILKPAAADCDLWHNTLTLKALVLDPAVTSVTFGMRTPGGEWQEAAGTADGEGHYTATFRPEWVASVNSKAQTVYTQKAGTGISAGKSYECRALLGEREYPLTIATPTGDIIRDGDMENGSLPCFTVSDSKNSTFWGSGNNNNTKTLCTQGSAGTNHYANMQSTYYIAAPAAGNLFTGTFNMSGTTGTVGFGQPYTYTARPRALRLKYHAQVGKVTDNKAGGPLAIGEQDKARVFVAIVNWSGRHEVASTFNIIGSSTCSGSWDPENGMESVNEGKILGYGSMWIEQSTAGDALVSTDHSLQIHWYDKDAAAPTGNYTLVISLSANAYGDFFNGCRDNHLWADDFEWVY